MENYTIIEQLDALLEFMVIQKDNHNIIEFFQNHQALMNELTDKLERDGFIKIITTTKDNGLTSIKNKTKVEGRLFYYAGGYKQKLLDEAADKIISARNERRIVRNERWLLNGTWTASVVGILLLLWQVFLYFYPKISDYPFVWIWETTSKK